MRSAQRRKKMDDTKAKLIHLDHCRGVGWKSIYRLLQADSTLTSLYQWTESDFHEILRLSSTSIHQLLTDLHSDTLHKQIQSINKNHTEVIAIFDEDYPTDLREIYEPPWLLYMRGDKSLLANSKKLAVVGSRQATEYGKFAIQQLFPDMIKKQITIVSGLARGVDTIAHETAISLGGKTIAVIAGGLGHIYPQENIQLAKEIMNTHLMISEYPPHTIPRRWQFPKRNRIISGMCHGTFVIEAKKRSGSFITADIALNEGREVFALPGNISSPYSIGTNNLIQKGAKLVTTAEDIFEELLDY